MPGPPGRSGRRRARERLAAGLVFELRRKHHPRHAAGGQGCTLDSRHFESQLDGTPYEPSAGACRTGSSLWRSQTPIRRELYVRDFSFGTGPDTLRAAIPFDESVRVGSFPVGTRQLYPRIDREVVSAALSDALPRTSVPAGEAVGCTVTPSDGSALGRPASVSAVVGGAPQTSPQPPAPAPPAPPPAPKTPVRRCAVPDVRGKPLASARRALIRSRWRSGRLAFAPSSLPKGHVLRQSPAARTKLPVGAAVALTLSNGRKR